MNPYLQALLRFWWILALGLLVASLAAVTMQYRVDLSSLPPTLTERSQPTYVTAARLLVTSSEVPYLRTSISRPVDTVSPGGAAPPPAQLAQEDRPDLGILVRAANLYPLLIESDAVAALRDRLVGPQRGTVSAQAIFSVTNPNRYEPSTLPVMEIFAASDSPQGAIALAQGTVDAFRRYIRNQQDRANLVLRERILLEQIQKPRSVTATGGGSLGLPILVVFALLAAFATLAVLLDRIFPLRPSAPVERLDRRQSVSDTA
jgi:hypothetical protein